jgi:hypothetical protein
MVFSEDIHVDHRTHELIVDSHDAGADGGLTRRVVMAPGSEMAKTLTEKA